MQQHRDTVWISCRRTRRRIPRIHFLCHILHLWRRRRDCDTGYAGQKHARRVSGPETAPAFRRRLQPGSMGKPRHALRALLWGKTFRRQSGAPIWNPRDIRQTISRNAQLQPRKRRRTPRVGGTAPFGPRDTECLHPVNIERGRRCVRHPCGKICHRCVQQWRNARTRPRLLPRVHRRYRRTHQVYHMAAALRRKHRSHNRGIQHYFGEQCGISEAVGLYLGQQYQDYRCGRSRHRRPHIRFRNEYFNQIPRMEAQTCLSEHLNTKRNVQKTP